MKYQRIPERKYRIPLMPDLLSRAISPIEATGKTSSLERGVSARTTHYEQAFDSFDAHKIARYDDSKVQEFLQAVGMVNDHTVECFRWQEVQLPAR